MTDFNIKVVIDDNNADKTIKDIKVQLEGAEQAAEDLGKETSRTTAQLNKAGRSARGISRVNKELKKTERTANSAGKALKAAFAVVSVAAIVQGVKNIVNLSNSFIELENKVTIAVGATGNAAQTLDELFAIADRTRTPIDSIATLYQRASISAKELGASQEQLAQFTETVGVGLAVQGGSAEQSAGALLQLSQALGSGIVRAEEFNSILEGAPVIARAAAKGIDEANGSVSRLRQLVISGQITSSELFSGILSQTDDLTKQLATTDQTIDQALTRIRNNSLQALGSSNLDPLVDSLNDFADLIKDPTFQKGIANLVTVIVRLAAASVDLAAGAGNFVTDLGNSLALLFANATGNLSVLDRLEAKLADTRKALELELSGGFGIVGIDVAFDSESELRQKIEDLEKQIKEETERAFGPQTVIAPVDVTQAKTETTPLPKPVDPETLAAQEKFLQGLRDTQHELATQAKFGELAAEVLADYATEQQIIALKLNPEQAKTARDLTEAIKDQRDVIAERQVLANETAFIESLEAESMALQNQIDIANGAADAIKNYQTNIEAKAISQDDGFLDLVNNITDGITEQQEALEAINRQSSLLNEIKGPQQDISQGIADLNALFADGKITADEFNAALANLSLQQSELSIQSGQGTFADGFRVSMEQMLESVRNFQSEAGMIFGEFFTGLSQGFADAVAQSIVFGESIEDAIGNVARDALSQLISGIVQLGVNYLLTQAIHDSTTARNITNTGLVEKANLLTQAKTTAAAVTASKTTTGAITSDNAAIAASAAPAAALESTATFGGAAVAGLAALAAILAFSKNAFADGGMVSGPGGPRSDAIPAMLSNGEFVVNAQSTRRFRPLLEQINNPRALRDGGGTQEVAAQPQLVMPEQTPQNINVVNVLDPTVVEDFINSPDGEQVIINSIERNAASINNLLGNA